MTRLISFINELILASFFLAIIGVATITTIGLSPAGADSKVIAGGDDRILGAQAGTIAVNTVDPYDSGDLLVKNGFYTYKDKLTAPLQIGKFEKQFISIQNATNETVLWQFELALPQQLQGSVVVGIKDAAGNLYSLNQTKRSIEIGANTQQIFSISYDLQEQLNFDLDLSVNIIQIKAI
jgi:hypothetical protein